MDMQPLNHFEAVSVLRETSDHVTIRVFRPTFDVGDFGQAEVDKLSHVLEMELHKQQVLIFLSCQNHQSTVIEKKDNFQNSFDNSLMKHNC